MGDEDLIASIRTRVCELGDAETLEAYDAALAAYVPLHEREPYAGLRVERDIAYGNDPRQRLDVFSPLAGAAPSLPILAFVHGGGFVRGDKRMPGAPYYDNAGVWAARHGFIGITINYRLAPAHVWPSGADDVAAVVAWIAKNGAAHGGDAQRALLMGHSAGASHIAAYLARRDAGHYADAPIAGAILLSGLYDLALAAPSPGIVAYFGDDAAERARRSPLRGLAATATPLLCVNAQFDARDFHAQTRALLDAIFAHTGRLPACATLPGHGHLSEVAHLNADDGLLAAAIIAFTASVRTRASRTY